MAIDLDEVIERGHISGPKRWNILYSSICNRSSCIRGLWEEDFNLA